MKLTQLFDRIYRSGKILKKARPGPGNFYIVVQS